jgi:hypothetical protein
VIQADLGKKMRPYLQITIAERGLGVNESIECLPRKCKYPEFKSQYYNNKKKIKCSFIA